jgi:glycosyltransferase involved in cell wall biosynthesis
MLPLSLVVPLHQGERFIADALESVRRQQQAPDEIIVVDDGSTDRGPEIAQSFPGVVLIRQERAGPGAARNRGIAAARHHTVALLDQDDLLRPPALRRHRESLEASSHALVSVCRQRFSVLEGETMPAWQRPELVGSDSLSWTPSCMCFRKSAFDRIGRFDETLRATSDLDWFRRFRASGLPFAQIDETLVDRRIHAGCQSGDAATMTAEMLTIARRAAAARNGPCRDVQHPPTQRPVHE